VEVIDYLKECAPVVSGTTVHLMISLSINYGWAIRHVDSSNALVQAKLK
jgi:hypothetical protein